MGTGQLTVAGPIRPRSPDERSIISKFVGKIRTWLGNGGSWGALSPLMAAHGWSDPRWWSDDPDDWPTRPTEWEALGLPPFGRGIDLIASTIAGVEINAYRHDRQDQIDLKMDPQPELLRDPDPVTTPWGWKYAMVNDLILYGNHFAFLGDPNPDGWPRWLEPLDVTSVDVAINQSGVWWRVNGEIVPYGDLFHISAGNRSGYLLGRGALAQYGGALGGALDVDRHAGRYFRRGGLPTAVLKVNDPDFQQDKATELKRKYMDTIGGRSREPLIIPGHYEFTPVVSDAEQQQLVEARTWDATVIAMILGIPSSYLGLQGPSMTYSNQETQDIGFIRDTVDRWAKPIEYAVTKWLLPNGQRAKFDWANRMRTDSKTKIEVTAAEVTAGVLTKEEARREYDRPPLPEEEQPQDLAQAAIEDADASMQLEDVSAAEAMEG